MEKEITVYDGQISKMQQQLEIVESQSRNYDNIAKAVDDNDDIKDEYRERLIQEMRMTRKSSKNVNDVWKMNKRINKMRRKHYGR